jgi:hypothetical protein
MASVLAYALVATSQTIAAQSANPHEAALLAPVLVSHPALFASVERIARGSALWRDAISGVRRTGRRVLVITSDDLSAGIGLRGTLRTSFNPGLLAEVVPVIGSGFQVPAVVVVVNLSLVQRMHEQLVTVPRDLDADLDRIMVHEIYGHAIPYLLAGQLSGRCADPLPGERAADACAIQRENAVRTELGLGRRTDDGILSLTLSAGQRLAAGLN